MDEAKRRRLDAAGYRVGTVDEFLGLTDEETALIEMKLALRQATRVRREGLGLTQAELAERLGSSQSRVAKLEGTDPTVSLDLLVRALLAMGATREEVSRSIGANIARAA